MTKHICTYFDYNFLPRGLALYYSIKKYHQDFKFYILTFDQKTYDSLSKLKDDNLILISFETYNTYFKTNIEKYDDKKQYYFSATPNICLYVLENFSGINSILYLDADVYVFNSLDTLYNEIGQADIAYCPHRTHSVFKFLAKNHGKYNVGVNFFKNSETGIKCLKEWKYNCENWYKGMPGYHLEYFSDQIFLDKWESRYPGVKIIQNIGINAAPWNAVSYTFNKKQDCFYINNQPLVIYHFSALKKVSDYNWNGNIIYYFGSIKKGLLEIYKFYIKEIESYGIENKKVENINLRFNLRKRMFYFIMKLFLNEVINIRE